MTDHAKDNAAGWMESISEMVETLNSTEDQEHDDAYTRINESVLEIAIRSDWTTPGVKLKPTEFMLLLTTGGPTLRLRGNLDQYQEPETAYLEYQDWGTPWAEYFGDNWDSKALLAFASCFYYGD